MVAGCGNRSVIPQTSETLRLLFQGCHQAGALEKALEVLSWMHISHVKPTAEMYRHLEDTIDIVQLWDRNVLVNGGAGKDLGKTSTINSQYAAPASQLHNAIMPAWLRPAPFDGKRTLYTGRQPDQTEAWRDFMLTATSHNVWLLRPYAILVVEQCKGNCHACRIPYLLLFSCRTEHGCLRPCIQLSCTKMKFFCGWSPKQVYLWLEARL